MRVCAPTRKQAGKAPSREFEQRFFNDQVLILDNMFVRRLTGIEGKDGNPLNEVRVLCNSILLNQGKLPLTSSLVAELCRLGYQAPAGKSLLIKTQGRRGGQADRSRLCAALRGFFAEIERRYLCEALDYVTELTKEKKADSRFSCNRCRAERPTGEKQFHQTNTTRQNNAIHGPS